MLENFTFVSPPKTDLQAVIKCSGGLVLLVAVADGKFLMFGLSVLIVKIGELMLGACEFSLGIVLVVTVGTVPELLLVPASCWPSFLFLLLW